ncbi:female sterile (1) nasrat [Sergentomyia squamirostris]
MRLLQIAIISFMWLVPRVSPQKTDQTVSDQQLLEVEQLRKEINPMEEKPRVSEKTLAEVDAIRDEIMKAVKNKKYAHGIAPEPQMLHTAHLWGGLSNLFKRQRVAQDDVQEDEEESDFHIQFPHLGQMYREVLHLASVEEDFSFDLGENVILWKTLQPRKIGKHCLIGITNSSVVLLKETEGHYEFISELELPSTPTCLEGFVQWDAADEAAEGIALVSVANELLWIDLGTNFDNLTISWRWYLHKNLTEVDFFSLMDEPMVILISEPSIAGGKTSADIYRFDYVAKDFWLVQTIPLHVPSTSIAVLEDGSDLIIAIPQKKTTVLFKYLKESNFNRHFKHFMDLSSEDVVHVASFRIGGHSHLAIGGTKPQIWRLEDNTMQSVEIRHDHLGRVDFWLPIVATTYRDDLILLVQHSVQLETHTVTKLEVLIWNGEFFTIQLNVPCILDDIQSRFGISCMLDFDRERGLEGSTIIRHGKNISILVPRDNADSGLFVINMEMKMAYHPEQEHLEEFKLMYDYFNTLTDYKDGVLKEAIDTIENAVKVNEFNKISAHWTVKSLETSMFEYTEDQVKFGQDNTISVGWKNWTMDDFELDVPTIAQAVEHIDNGLNKIVSDAVERYRKRDNANSPSTFLGSIFSNGQLSTRNMYILNEENHPPEDHQSSDHRDKRQIISNLTVKYLEVETIDGIPVSDFVFATDDKISVESDLIITGPLIVEDVTLRGKVNGKFLHQEAIAAESETYYRDIFEFDSLQIKDDLYVYESFNGMGLEEFSQLFITPPIQEDVIADDNVTIKGDLTFNTINGINWKQFVQKIVMTNQPISLDEIKVNGEVTFMDDSQIDTLNSVIFPDGYLWAANNSVDKPPTVAITGEKQFKTLVVSNIDAENTINGMIVNKIVTINSDQNIPGETTFSHLEVVGDLEINGKVYGRHLDEFLENPTLLETKHVRSACIFRDLRVEGNLFINETVNEIDLHAILSDAIYATDKTINVSSFKSFQNVIFNAGIELTSKLLNGIPLAEYVTKDTEQELNLKKITGDIYFHSLTLDGLFNSVNVTELDYNSVKRTGQQHTEAEIIFENDDHEDFMDIIGGNIEITDSINGFKMHDLIDISRDFELDARVEFEELRVDHLMMEGDLIGEFLVNDIDLSDFDRRRLSLSREQTITAPYYIQHANITSINVTTINTYPIDHVETLLKNAENLHAAIRAGQIPIESLTVHGDLQAEMINSINFTMMAQDAFWLNNTNIFRADVNFLDTVIIQGDLQLKDTLNKRNIEYFVENLIQKTTDPIVIDGEKIFKKGLHALQDVDAEYLNLLKVSDILVQNKHNVINGDLQVTGNLTVKKLILDGKINGFPISKLKELYSYDIEERIHHIYGDVHFQDHPYVHHLIVDGWLNGLENISEYIKGIQMKNQKEFNITGRKIFTNNVYIEDSLQADHVNGVDFQDFVDNVILIDDPRESITISGNVTFLNGYIETPEVFVTENLTAVNIVDCSPGQLIRDAIWTDRNMELPINIKFSGGALSADLIESNYLNGIPMSKFITLHTEQEIEDIMVMPDVLVNQPIKVDGFVNGVKLPEEHDNTLMVHGDQIIETSTSFQQVRVLNSLTTTGLVNEQNIRNVARLNSDIVITAPVSFDHLQVDKVYSEHHISGINFTDWQNSALWKKRKDLQIIGGEWQLKNCIIEDSLEGNGSINEIDFVHMMSHFQGNRQKLLEKVDQTEKLYGEFCQKINSLLHESRHDICFFRYFERHSSIWEKGEKITSHLFYENNGEHFFIYSAGCLSKLHRWDWREKIFTLVATINAGQVDEWIHVDDVLGNAHLVANGSPNPKCNESGSFIWKWNGSGLFKFNQLDQYYYDLLGNRQRPGYFYAIDQDNVVRELDLKGHSGDMWNTTLQSPLKFIPQEVNLGLAVTDGKRIKVIEQRQARRRKRFPRNTDTTLDSISIQEDPEDSFASLLKEYSHMTKSDSSDSLAKELLDNEIVGDKLFDQFQDLIKQGSKTFIDTSFKLIELLNEYQDENQESGDYDHVAVSADNSTIDHRINITKEQFLDTLKYVLTKKGFLVDAAMKALSETNATSENSTFSVVKINGTTFGIEEDVLDLWLMELLVNDKINEIEEINTSTPAPTSSESSESSHNESVSLRVSFPDEKNLSAILAGRRDWSEPTVIYSEMDPSFEEFTGEIVTLYVGHPMHRRRLIAAASRRKSTVPGRHDVIYLYENTIGERNFQTIPCQEPSGLTALHLRDETLLIFVEARVSVQIYSYQGIIGFTKLFSFELNSPALHLSTVILPVEEDYRANYLVVTMSNEILFLEAKMMGKCRIDVEVNCDE